MKILSSKNTLLLLILSITIYGCENNSQKIVGSWKFERAYPVSDTSLDTQLLKEIKEGIKNYYKHPFTYVFYNDGTGVIKSDFEPEYFTYKIDGANIRYTDERKKEGVFEIEKLTDDELILSLNKQLNLSLLRVSNK